MVPLKLITFVGFSLVNAAGTFPRKGREIIPEGGAQPLNHDAFHLW